ncbi:pinin-like [Prunus avium]|uniref:Pinin-like n=1 Tax=Prunus avium TaxID=42229 RepID=A0A6P5TUF5_PRUAV|nr:pinin-like [Prunus avium]
MGCCMSTTTTEKSPALGPQKLQHSLVGTQGPRSDDAHDSRAPPPVDEETVKEVLSETPRPKPTPSSPPPPPLMPFTKLQEHEPVDQDQEKRAQEPVFEKKIKQEDPEKIEEKIPIYNNNGEISEVSEICSLSESMSTTTITRDDDEEVHQRVNRSPMRIPKNRDPVGQRRDRVVGKSPTRRTESSPGRKYGPNGNNGNGSVRLVQSREPGPGQQPLSRRGSAELNRRGSRAESNRRDPGESSGRRSRSPATRVTDGGGANRANVGRSPSARRSGRYPGRTTVGPVESSGSTRRVAEEPMMEEGKWPANESIDNPLVSLECFIFL